MFLMRPYFVPRRSPRHTTCTVLLAAMLLSTQSASQASAANSDVIVQPLGTSHGNSDVLVMPNSIAPSEHGHEPDEKPLLPDPPTAGSSQNFSSLIDILQNKPKVDAPVPGAAAPEVAVPEIPPQEPPIVDPPEPPPTPLPQKQPVERPPQKTVETPRLPPISPRDLLPVPYNSRNSGAK